VYARQDALDGGSSAKAQQKINSNNSLFMELLRVKNSGRQDEFYPHFFCRLKILNKFLTKNIF